MRIEHVLAALVAIWAIYVIVRHANRTEADRERPSWAVRGINALGGNVEAKRLLPATRELAGRAAGKAVGTAGAKVADLKGRAAERRGARDDRIGEIGEKTRDLAARGGQAVVDAAERRWNGRTGDTRLITRPDRDGANEPKDSPDKADQSSTDDEPAPQKWRLLKRFVWWRRGTDTPAAPPSGNDADPDAGDGDGPLPCHTACPKCGSTVKAVIPAADNDINITCLCGHRIKFYRAPHEVPEDHAVMRAATCKTCGTEHTATIPAGENGHTVVCACGTRLHFVRKSPLNKEEAMSNENLTDDEKNDIVKEAMKKVMSMSPEEMDAYLKEQAAKAGAGAPGEAQTPVPLTWRPVAQRLADLNPDTDAELINFMSGEVAGMCAYAAGYEQLFETCTKSLGLDPRSVAGLGEFGDKIITVTNEMALVHRRFVAMYQEVMKMVADGTVMPHRGRFFSGDVQV